MNRYFFSFFSVAVFSLAFNSHAQVDSEGALATTGEVFPLLAIVEGEDGEMSLVMSASQSSPAVKVPTIDGRDRHVFVTGEPVISVVMPGTSGGIEDGFVLQRGDEMFVWNQGVADALGLTSEQRDEIPSAVHGLLARKSQGIPDLTEMGQRISIDEIRGTMVQALKPDQQTKFAEMSFQLAGGLGSPSLNDRMLGHLNLTPAQKEQIRAIVANREMETKNARQKFDFLNATTEERMAFSGANYERTEKFAGQIKAVLTPAQRTRAEELTADIPELREKLGVSQEGLGEVVTRDGPQIEPQTQEQQQQTAPVYTPGPNSWRPGQPLPFPHVPSERIRRFPRSEN